MSLQKAFLQFGTQQDCQHKSNFSFQEDLFQCFGRTKWFWLAQNKFVLDFYIQVSFEFYFILRDGFFYILFVKVGNLSGGSFSPTYGTSSVHLVLFQMTGVFLAHRICIGADQPSSLYYRNTQIKWELKFFRHKSRCRKLSNSWW